MMVISQERVRPSKKESETITGIVMIKTCLLICVSIGCIHSSIAINFRT
jgi:hypothetical protein